MNFNFLPSSMKGQSWLILVILLIVAIPFAKEMGWFDLTKYLKKSETAA
jgi:hypothetical protein